MENNMHAWGDVFVNPTNRQPGFPIVVNMSQPERETGVETETHCIGINGQNKLTQIYCPYKSGRKREDPSCTFDLICTFA